MSYTTFLGDTFEDEHDEELCRKFGDTYKFFKTQYPELHKLPTEDVQNICHIFRESPYGDTFEKSVERTKQYINQHMPQWQKKYINPMVQKNRNYSQYNQFPETKKVTSDWNEIKKFTQDIVNTTVPYIPTYYAGYGLGLAQNTFDKLKNIYDAYKQNGAFIAAQQYAEPSVKKALKAADWLTPLPISDVNKHQYVSCIGSVDGPLAAAETLSGGIYKEYIDYNKKANNPELLKKYNGKWGIIKDNVKDLSNDFKGAWKGLQANNPEECEELLPENYRNKRY